MTKNWPTDGSTVRFSDIVEPLREAVNHLYKMDRLSLRDVPYQGLPLGDSESATCLEPAERLTAVQLQYDDEDQGRDAMTVLLGIAVQLGIEQGRRIDRASRWSDKIRDIATGRFVKDA